jgi:Zn-dependent protease
MSRSGLEEEINQLFFRSHETWLKNVNVKEKNKRLGGGLLVLLAKVGPKVVAGVLKALKTVKAAKLGLAAGSMATYSALYTWQFAAALMLMLFIHESGHIWAMKRCGMKTKGIYFIPLLGGAAVADDMFPSRGAEVFVAIAGPIAGLLLAALSGCVYLVTQQPLWAAIAGWMAFVNLFNLAPINPLDGGRIMKSVAFSIGTRTGLVMLAISMVVGIVGGLKLGLGLVVFVTVVGGLELFLEWVRYKRSSETETLPTMNAAHITMSLVAYIAVAALLLGLMYTMSHEPGADIAMKILQDR